MRNCAVYGCRNTSGRTGNKEKGIYFHQFPKREQSPKRYIKWLKFCNRKTFTPKKSSRICSKHFKNSDFDESQLLKIRLMPHAKFKGPTLKPGAIPTPTESNTTRKSSSEARNEEKKRKIIVDEILQNSNESIRKSSYNTRSETKRKRVRRNEKSIRIDQVPKVEENLKSHLDFEVFQTDVLNKGIQCELGIESYRNINFISDLKSESCCSNLIQSSEILNCENIKLETDDFLEMSLCPWIRTPLTDLTGSIVNNQWRSDCSAIELKVLDCYEAYGLDKGAEKCITILKDFQECVGKRKQYARVKLMQEERERQIRNGENTYAPGPLPHAY